MSMSKAAKRVAIAKDVLAQLKAKKFTVAPGTYVEFNEDDVRSMVQDNELQKELKKLSKPCRVCALGACFVAGVDKFDKFKVSDSGVRARTYYGEAYVDRFINEDNMRQHLSEFFSEEQLELIETAFEGFTPHGCIDGSDVNADGLKWFRAQNLKANEGKRVRNTNKFAEHRMREIMRNIIRNNGTFIVPKSMRAK